MLEKRGELRRKYEFAVAFEVKKRLDAYPVTGKENTVLLLIVYRKGKYTVEALNAGASPFYVAFQDYLGI